MENNVVSIIIPVYNTEKYLDECIKSIFAQTYQDYEILLVDDGSTDNSGKMCDEYAKNNVCVKTFHKANGGQSSARNLALNHITGDYLFFLDSDDAILPDTIEIMLKACVNENADISCCGVTPTNTGCSNYTYDKKFVMNGEEAFAKMLVCEGLDSNVWAKMYKKSLWDNLRFPEGIIFEDINVTYKTLLASNKIIHIGKALYIYRIHDSSTTTSEFTIRRESATIEAKKLYIFTKTNYPKHAAKAFALYMRNVTENYAHISRLQDKTPFKEYYEHLDSIINDNILWLATTKYITLERKLMVLSIKLHLYKLIRTIKMRVNNKSRN